jgi:hypothetical protein
MTASQPDNEINTRHELHGVQVRMARCALRMEVRKLAALASVDKMTVVRIEGGESLRASTSARLRTALENAGIVFLPAVEGSHGPGIALKWGASLHSRSKQTSNFVPQ